MHPLPIHFFGQWQKYQTVHNPFFIETMNIEHYACAYCHAFDRERLCALYLSEYFVEAGNEIKLLDIAPGKALETFLKKDSRVSYRSMDLLMNNVDDNLDITNMHAYNDGRFDFFICSHVLEHIPDDMKAMKELYRVLRKGGKGIVMIPLNLQLKETIEDATCTDKALQWKYFFQDDHVRMYAKHDFISRLMSVGFSVEQLGIDHFSKEIFERNAIYPTSVLYVVGK
jgi:SAM-dependent methyltransferase